MHGCRLRSALPVNAEVDSMGGVFDGGVGIGIKTSPRQAAIEKAQAELRLEYDVREERKRELEFLEKGGNPLDFKLGNAASVSIQSTSLTDQLPEHEAKGSFALTGSPHGDSVESSGRPGARTVCEPNSADNLLLFDGESDFLGVEGQSVRPTRSNIFPSGQSTHLEGSQNTKVSGDSAAFSVPKKAYRRRNRSRPNRDGTRSGSTDIVPSRSGHVTHLASRHGPKDAKGANFDSSNQKEQKISLNCKPTSPNVSMTLRAAPSSSQLNMELDSGQAVELGNELAKDGLPEPVSDFDASKNMGDNQLDRHSQVDAQETPIHLASEATKSVGVGGQEKIVSASLESSPCAATTKLNQTISGQLNGFSKGDRKNIPSLGQNNSAASSKRGIDSESSFPQICLDVNDDSELCGNVRNINSNVTEEQTLVRKVTPNMEGDEMMKEKNETQADGRCAVINDGHNSIHDSHQDDASIFKSEEEFGTGSILQNEVKAANSDQGKESDGQTASETERRPFDLLVGDSNPQKENACLVRPPVSVDSSTCELPDTSLSVRDCNVTPLQLASTGIHFKLEKKAHEDFILEEARIIEAKRKRIAELSVGTLPSGSRRRSHWDLVLEEMAWLANDFAQERVWKITAAAQICHHVAFTSRLRFEEHNLRWKQKMVAYSMAKSVMEFWHSAKEMSNESEMQSPGKKKSLAVEGYAVRYLKYDSSFVQLGLAEAPATPDRVSDLGIQEVSWEDHFTEENLFYTVPAGAMETYRKSIESYLVQNEKNGCAMQEEVGTSIYDAVADIGSQENAYEEYEGEKDTYFFPGACEDSQSSKIAQKKWKNMTRSFAATSYGPGAELTFTECMENKIGTQQSVLMGKRPANNLGSIPTKRVRTASRLRILSPFGAGSPGCVQAPNKTDASSGDTNSFQDDQSTLHGGSQMPNSLEVESGGPFEKQLPFESAEVYNKPKKKKKGSTDEHRWQVDSNFQNEERDHSRKRLESHKFESNGSSGLYGQHIAKKPKMLKQSLDNSSDNHTPMVGSIPSPVTSQMSNMSNPNKFIKMLGGRDRGKKAKTLKMSAGHSASGCTWSPFEDKALVVLVHDMGPNWQLVSDAINSTLQFKRIFRKPIECKERHKILMDRTAGDGADSAEDSGSSQPYPSTLPGIPKGSARQLFQRLQGPMEEDTLKSHFEKIIMIGQKQHFRRNQNYDQDIKQIQPHNSHLVALSQVCPNNLNGGPPLTPLDLCNATSSSPDIPTLGYQGSQAGLGMPNQGAVASMLPTSGANSSLQGCSSMVPGSNFSAPSGALNASRDGRYVVPRTAPGSVDEGQRIQQYNQSMSGRNIQPSNLSVSGALPGTERGIRMLPGGNGMGIMGGASRSMPMVRPGFQGMTSSSTLNSGSMLSSSMIAMSSPVNMQSGAGSGQGNSMLRQRDALHMIRPIQNPENQRHLMVPELQMQATQGNNQGVPPFNGLSSGFSHQTATPPVTYPLHQHQLSPQQTHVLNNSHHSHIQGSNHAHQAYAVRVAKEGQPQQRLLNQQQQQQQFSASNALMPHVQAQPQIPISSSAQSNSQIQSQTSSPPVSVSSLTSSSSLPRIPQHQQKHHIPPHGLGRNPQTGGGGFNNQMAKQRQNQPQPQPQPQPQQQFQQSGRHHPHQRQQLLSHQQAKLMKGVGRGNMLMHQNLSLDPSLLNGVSATPGSQSTEKGEQAMHFMQGQALYTGPGLSPVQPSKPLVPSHSSNQLQHQQKLYSGQTMPSSKQLQQLPFHSDNANQGHIPPVTSVPTLSTSHHAVPPSVMSSSNHQQPHLQQLQPHQKSVSQTQPAVQRVLHQNRRVNSDPVSKLQANQMQAEQQMQACIDMPNAVPVVSSATSPQWKTSEALHRCGVENPTTQVVTSGGRPSINSCGSEPITPVGQGLGQRQSSGSLPPLGSNVDAQWQQQQSQKSLSQPPQVPQQQQQEQQSPQRQLRPQVLGAADTPSASRDQQFVYQTH